MITPKPRDVFVPNPSVFYVLDYDRTLGDVGKHYELLVGVLEAEGIASSQRMQELRAEVEASGGSFDPLSYLFSQNMLDDSALQRLQQCYLSRSDPEELLTPGVDRLLDYLNESKSTYGIVTYGNPHWQHLKLRASGLDKIPYIITDTKHKGELLSSWRLSSGEFRLPARFDGIVVESLVLIDDKAESFVGLPPLPTRGYHLYDSTTAVPSQAGELPSNVTRVASLDELISLLRANRHFA